MLPLVFLLARYRPRRRSSSHRLMACRRLGIFLGSVVFPVEGSDLAEAVAAEMVQAFRASWFHRTAHLARAVT